MWKWFKKKFLTRLRVREWSVGPGLRRLSYLLGLSAVLTLVFVAASDDGTRRNGLEKTWGMAKNGVARVSSYAVAFTSGQTVDEILPKEALPGFLYIEAPQLYTRERLVNDRFRQANWLSEELKRTNQSAESLNFSSPSRIALEKKTTHLIAQLGEGNLRTKEPDEVDSVSFDTLPGLDQLKLLERRLHYRAELRNELMDTQLDDGHDLDGNTLYRLNFDAVAMPWADIHSNPGAALFIVTARQPAWRTALRNPPPGSNVKAKPETKAKAEVEYDSNLKQSLEDDLELLNTWQREMQVFLARVLEYRTNTFKTSGALPNPTDPKEDIALDWFLRVTLIRSFLDLLAHRIELGCDRDCRESDSFRKKWASEDDETLAWRRNRLAEWIGFAYRSKRESPDVLDGTLQKRFQMAIGQASKVNELRFRGGKSEFDYQRDCALAMRTRRIGDSASPACRPSLPDPSNLLAVVRLISVVNSLDALIAAEPGLTFPIKFDRDGNRGGPADLDKLINDFNNVVPNQKKIAAQAETWGTPEGQATLRQESEHICAEKRASLFDYGRCEFLHASVGSVVEEMVASFITARIRGALPAYRDSERPVDRFLQVSLAGCGFTRCRFEVRKRDRFRNHENQDFLNAEKSGQLTGAQESGLSCATDVSRYVKKFSSHYPGGLGEKYTGRLAQFVSEMNPNVQNELYAETVELYSACLLRSWLDERRNDLVVYGVSPRIGGVVSLHGAEQRSNVGAAGGSKYLEDVSVSLGSQSESRLDEASVTPLVVGFSQITRKGESLAKPRHETVFGWAVRSAQSADGTWKAGHHRLAAVVSVPSWWKRLEFVITACWAPPSRGRGLGQKLLTDPVKICSDPNPDAGDPEDGSKFRRTSTMKREFRIQLPRKAEDVTSRFNFDFIKTPYFDATLRDKFAGNNGPIKLEVGRKGRIVLSGERLWRGTVVTLGDQPAENIVVLPDMKGVIAEFNCVSAPPGEDYIKRYEARTANAKDRHTSPHKADITVWTSEGRTSSGVFAELHPFVQRSRGEKPCFAQN